MERSSGILLHISSLPGPFGIGTLGKEAYDFVDQLKVSGTSYWQILPTTPLGYSNSPYASTSCFANNVAFVDPRELAKDGYLDEKELSAFEYKGDFYKKTDYEFANQNSRAYLELAYKNISSEQILELEDFIEENSAWIHDFAIYDVLHSRKGGKMWQDWDPEERDRSVDFLADFLANPDNKEELNLVYFAQWQFILQWKKLRAYANENNVFLIGDMPIFPALDSADAWANKELFQLDELGNTIFKAGVPPDYFSEDGQLWGNPLYNWEVNKATGYKWWIDRVRHSMNMFDIVRIDHFRGFSSYWAVPGEDTETAKNGAWVKGPGMDLFNTLHQEIDDLKIIAEDLGDIDEDVEILLADSGYPGMNVMLFSFDDMHKSAVLPYTFKENSVVYTGTHDNDTSFGFLERTTEEVRNFIFDYIRLDKNIDWKLNFPYSPAVNALLASTWACNSKLAIAPIQDFLGMGNDRRMNTPSTVNDFNWTFRLSAEELASLDLLRIYKLNRTYRRLSDEDLEFVSAAGNCQNGEAEISSKDEKNSENL